MSPQSFPHQTKATWRISHRLIIRWHEIHSSTHRPTQCLFEDRLGNGYPVLHFVGDVPVFLSSTEGSPIILLGPQQINCFSPLIQLKVAGHNRPFIFPHCPLGFAGDISSARMFPPPALPHDREHFLRACRGMRKSPR